MRVFMLPRHLLARFGLRGPPRSHCCCCTRTTRPAAAASSRSSSRRPRRHAVRIVAILSAVAILTYSARPHYLGSDQPPRERGPPEGEGALLAARARALLGTLLDGLRRAGGQVPRRAQRRRAALPQDAGPSDAGYHGHTLAMHCHKASLLQSTRPHLVSVAFTRTLPATFTTCDAGRIRAGQPRKA